MVKVFSLIVLIFMFLTGYSQPKTMADIKMDIEKSSNSPLYVKDVLKKKFKLDTVVVTRTTHFNNLSEPCVQRGAEKSVRTFYHHSGSEIPGTDSCAPA